MNNKSMTYVITIFFAVGGVVILTLTWLEPMSLSERVAQSIIGAAGIMTIFVRPLLMQIKAIRVHIVNIVHKTDTNEKGSLQQ